MRPCLAPCRSRAIDDTYVPFLSRVSLLAWRYYQELLYTAELPMAWVQSAMERYASETWQGLEAWVGNNSASSLSGARLNFKKLHKT